MQFFNYGSGNGTHTQSRSFFLVKALSIHNTAVVVGHVCTLGPTKSDSFIRYEPHDVHVHNNSLGKFSTRTTHTRDKAKPERARAGEKLEKSLFFWNRVQRKRAREKVQNSCVGTNGTRYCSNFRRLFRLFSFFRRALENGSRGVTRWSLDYYRGGSHDGLSPPRAIKMLR